MSKTVKQRVEGKIEGLFKDIERSRESKDVKSYTDNRKSLTVLTNIFVQEILGNGARIENGSGSIPFNVSDMKFFNKLAKHYEHELEYIDVWMDESSLKQDSKNYFRLSLALNEVNSEYKEAKKNIETYRKFSRNSYRLYVDINRDDNNTLTVSLLMMDKDNLKKVYLYRNITASNFKQACEIISNTAKEHNLGYIYMDTSGLGISVADILQKEYRDVRVLESRLISENKCIAYNQIKGKKINFNDITPQDFSSVIKEKDRIIDTADLAIMANSQVVVTNINSPLLNLLALHRYRR